MLIVLMRIRKQTLTLYLFSLSSLTVLVPLTWTLRINNSSKNSYHNWNLENGIFTSMLKTRINGLLTQKKKKLFLSHRHYSNFNYPRREGTHSRAKGTSNSTHYPTRLCHSHFSLQEAYVRLSGQDKEEKEASLTHTVSETSQRKRKTQHTT